MPPEKCPTCFGTGRRPDVERLVCMFCGGTSLDVDFIFSTDGLFGLVSICDKCIEQGYETLKQEEAKEIKFKPKGPNHGQANRGDGDEDLGDPSK